MFTRCGRVVFQIQLLTKTHKKMGYGLYKGTIMFEIEHYKKPTDWAQVATYAVSIIAIIVVLLDIFVWRP